jgi:uncharacterized SAM-binding protein YcdF (DUF218 family)
MQSKQSRRTQTSSKSILLLLVISLFSCIIGIMLGAGGFWYYEQINSPSESALSQPESPSLLPQLGSDTPVGEGFFIVINGKFVKIPEFPSDNQIDFALLPSTSEKQPTFAIKGANYPIGNLKLSGYIAGIGVDAEFTQTGAVINSVFENSPAKLANLQPGEVIVSVNGENPKSPMVYQPGKKDLFGEMQDQITLVVMSGTNSRTVQLPRTYLGTVDSNILSVTNPSVKVTIEPKDDYILLHVDRELKSGVYRFEFQTENVISVGGIFFEPTPTPTLPPIPIPTQKWVFVVK